MVPVSYKPNILTGPGTTGHRIFSEFEVVFTTNTI